jgi:peptide-methionine (R)-S-oxide reductase
MSANPTSKKTEAQYQAELSPIEFEVTQRSGTERPFTGKYWDHWSTGIYQCVCCGVQLFSSNTKFDAGCGWPSFSDADSTKIIKKPDYSHGMIRTEVMCANCGGHLGHLFDDGPTPTGLRYCINSVSIDFQKKKLGYE